MKKLLMTLSALLVFSCSPAYASNDVEMCDATASLIYEVTIGRDRGLSPEGMFKVLTDLGFPISTADLMVQYVYRIHPEKSPSSMREYFYYLCVTDPV